ncbi:MAG: precorrin-3B C(17)-methyltransferase [Bacillota bacterium]
MNKLYVVGIGPGDSKHMTIKAKNVLESVDTIIGYKTYIQLIKNDYSKKELISFPMRSEVERCEFAIKKAKEKKVALISSGDAGVYGMAGALLEISQDANIEVIPGMTAIQAAASSLGAPIMHDFAAISLSDLLTDWEVIIKRLKMAAKGDFVTCLYNPRSKKRVKQIVKAREIFIKESSKDKVVGIVKNAKRENEEVYITDLENMLDYNIDMSTLVIIGNKDTLVKNNKMITKRGYNI